MTLAGELVSQQKPARPEHFCVKHPCNRGFQPENRHDYFRTSGNNHAYQDAAHIKRVQQVHQGCKGSSRDLGKQVQLYLEGKEVELDKTIIEAINDPLTHLVRKFVDHGIEPPETRKNNGKPATGSIKLKAYHEAGQVNIEIEDDGKGIDGNEVAAAAVRKGLITEQDAASMGIKDKINLIFLPGFSTAKTITDVSGRGVGMDVVKTNLDRLAA
jgi:chemotaxis protein histidine kinase CheA